MNNIDRIIREMIKEFRSKLSDKEIEKCFSKLEKLYSDYASKIKAEPLIIKYYQVNSKGENYPLSYHQYNFVRNLEVILKNQSQLSLEEVINFMEKVINSNLSGDYGTFETIFESRPDILVDDAIDFVSKIVRDAPNNLHTKLHSFLGNKIFKIMLELSPESSLEKVGKQFSEIVDRYFLNVASQENESALAEICELCMEGTTEKMQKFDFSNFDLDQDSAGVLKALLQHCMNISNQEASDNEYELHKNEIDVVDNYNSDSSFFDYEINNVWH